MKFLFLIALGALSVAQGESRIMADFVVGSNKFSANVYKEMQKTNSGNFLVCPLSAETILALVHSGAGGQTAQQLAAAFYLPDDMYTIQYIFRKATARIQGNENYTLSSANKVYVKDGYKIKDHFKNVTVHVFKADIQNIDFEKSEEAASEINRWVEEKTDNKIKNLIDANTLNEDTRSVLVNAMYFHGKWVNPFSKRTTSKRTFYLNNKDKTETEMMDQTDYLRYYESSELNAKFLELHYEGNDTTMTFVLPNDKEGLHTLEEHIDDVFVAPQYSSPRVHAVIPKFTIESTIEFKPILQTLGIKDAFEDYADFNEILVDQHLKISKVLQKTFIEVEETGTTAAAATYVNAGVPQSFNPRPASIEQFIAEHPFIFYLKFKNNVLFAGRYSNP